MRFCHRRDPQASAGRMRWRISAQAGRVIDLLGMRIQAGGLRRIMGATHVQGTDRRARVYPLLVYFISVGMKGLDGTWGLVPPSGYWRTRGVAGAAGSWFGAIACDKLEVRAQCGIRHPGATNENLHIANRVASPEGDRDLVRFHCPSGSTWILPVLEKSSMTTRKFIIRKGIITMMNSELMQRFQAPNHPDKAQVGEAENRRYPRFKFWRFTLDASKTQSTSTI